MTRVLKLSLACLVLATVACGDGGNIIVTPTQTVIIGQPSPSPTPTPRADSSVGFDAINIRLFGHNPGCANPPANGSFIVRLGCQADITATPTLNGVPVSPAVHGPSCLWLLNGQAISGEASTSVVRVVVNDSNPFNVEAHGLAAGTFTLRAQVKGVLSDVRTFSVQ